MPDTDACQVEADVFSYCGESFVRFYIYAAQNGCPDDDNSGLSLFQYPMHFL